MAKRKPAAPDKRDESAESDSSRRSSTGKSVSDYLADEIGALDSMRHRDRKNEKEEESGPGD
ncbi:MAG: hypothetical protein HKN17_09185 [Rhodothermales bacterium]|nr:hypothetical protein [Rhodothermales bacterium]